MGAGAGAVVGSFLTVVVHRLPRGESVVWPGSHCPRCGHRLRFYENIPLLSYLLQRGRCRACGGPISIRYPLIEALAALWGGLIFATFPVREALFWAPAGWSWIALAWIDAEHGILPDSLLAFHLILLLLAIPAGVISSRAVVPGMMLGAGIMGGLRYLWFLLTQEEGLGGGDVKLLALLGGWLGPLGVFWVLGGGALLALGGMVAIPALRRRVVFFGPYLLLSAAFFPFLGRWVVDNLVSGVYI